jgi:hypothetical protein
MGEDKRQVRNLRPDLTLRVRGSVAVIVAYSIYIE